MRFVGAEVDPATCLRIFRSNRDAGLIAALSKTYRLTSQSLILGLGAYLAIQREISPGMVIAGSILLGRALAPIDQHHQQVVGARAQAHRPAVDQDAALGRALVVGLLPARTDTRWWHEAVSMQWRISLALAPMSLYFFQGFSLAGLWVNLWAIPWVTLVVTPLSLLGLLCPPLWVPAGWASDWLLTALGWAAQTPWALVEVGAPPLIGVIAATLCALGVAWPGHALRRTVCAVAMLSLVCLGWR